MQQRYLFQFIYCAIKRIDGTDGDVLLCYFNSFIVQLKEHSQAPPYVL